MQTDLHPSDVSPSNVTCSGCQNTFVVHTTKQGDFTVEMCLQCHPAYTGKRRVVTTGKIDRFAKKYRMSDPRLFSTEGLGGQDESK